MVLVHLTEEEKLQVVFLALGLFLVSCLVSICLAASFCPLNRWLHERNERKRRRRQQLVQQQSSFYVSAGAQSSKGSLASFSAPPPAYEAALRATRLQSIQSIGLPTLTESPADKSQPLDLGDYFHEPRDSTLTSSASNEASTQQVPPPRAPLMMRLWVRVLEPGELVARARQSASSQASTCEQPRRSICRQLSIPQLFGSLVSLAASRRTQPEDNDSLASAQQRSSYPLEAGAESSSSSGAVSLVSEQLEQNQLRRHTLDPIASGTSKAPISQLSQSVERDQTVSVVVAETSTSSDLDNSKQAGGQTRKRSKEFQNLGSSNSVTSRVLHMNVASFSYVRDESLISTKKHCQLNYHHFTASPSSLARAQSIGDWKSNPSNKTSGGANTSSKLCQLLISICDLENVLNSCRINERACAMLSPSSSIYVQCEILAPKSRTASKLLRYPLRAFQGHESSQTHTVVNFASSIPAMAIERMPSVSGQSVAGGGGSSSSSTFMQDEGATSSGSEEASSLASKQSSCSASSSVVESAALRHSGGCSSSSSSSNRSTNWRHEPSADGRSIVVFTSVPKQLTSGQADHLSSVSLDCPDLIQFDSVFVSPILSRSLIEEGSIRFRVYGQCRYVNELCLAELKLPLKQLLHSSTRDNLGDVPGDLWRPPGQSDLILNNLLANLVTASTCSPLSSLIEQISGEEREQASEHEANEPPATPPARWPHQLRPVSRSESLRSSSSFNEALCRLAWRKQQASQPDDQAAELECEQLRLEQNYCRSLAVSHWLNYLATPSYECQLADEPRGKLILGLTYLPTSNRIIFNAHRATIETECEAKQRMKSLRLQSGTCYLVRFLMLAEGRVVKRRHTAPAERAEWDSQEPITFDLVNVAAEHPAFVVALVMRSAQVLTGSGSMQNLSRVATGAGAGVREDKFAQSEPETVRRLAPGGACCAARRIKTAERDLVIGHLVLGHQIWRELRSQPRKQIVRQFKLY